MGTLRTDLAAFEQARSIVPGHVVTGAASEAQMDAAISTALDAIARVNARSDALLAGTDAWISKAHE